MSRTKYRSVKGLVWLLTALTCAGIVAQGQSRTSRAPARSVKSATSLPSTKNGEWPCYTGDNKGTRYSPLDQINAENFNQLEIEWRFKTDNLGTRPEYKLEGTPLMVNGMLYATGGTRRSVVALKAGTGELVWVHAEFEGARAVASPRQLSGRGLSYWTDGRGDDRDQPFILGATNLSVPTFKAAFLAILRQFQRAEGEELSGHELYALCEEEYAAADAWVHFTVFPLFLRWGQLEGDLDLDYPWLAVAVVARHLSLAALLVLVVRGAGRARGAGAGEPGV